MRRARPIIYVRTSSGGRAAARAQEAHIRERLEAANVDHAGFHVYCDVDTSGDRIGTSLSLLLSDARLGSLGVIVVQDLARLGQHVEILFHVLLTIDSRGGDVVVANNLRQEPWHVRRPTSFDSMETSLPRLVLSDRTDCSQCPHCGGPRSQALQERV